MNNFEDLCYCKLNNGGANKKRCYFKLLLNLMKCTNYFSKLQCTVSVDQIEVLHRYILVGYRAMLDDPMSDLFFRQWWSYTPTFICCSGHDKFGFQCNKPSIKTQKIKKDKHRPHPDKKLYLCNDHILDKKNRIIYRHCEHTVSLCNGDGYNAYWRDDIFDYNKRLVKTNKYDLVVDKKMVKNIDNYIVEFDKYISEKNILASTNKNNEKCKYLDPNKKLCNHKLIAIDYENEIHFLCIKHHYKYIKSQYSKFKDDDIEFLRTILQPKTDLLTYQAIMSKISFSR
jgi:hypothetical protein